MKVRKQEKEKERQGQSERVRERKRKSTGGGLQKAHLAACFVRLKEFEEICLSRSLLHPRPSLPPPRCLGLLYRRALSL